MKWTSFVLLSPLSSAQVLDYDVDFDLGDAIDEPEVLSRVRRGDNSGITAGSMYSTINRNIPKDHWGGVFKAILKKNKRSFGHEEWPDWAVKYWTSQRTRSTCDGTMGCGGLFNLTAIDKYGCWCNFDGTSTIGKGEPQDEIDGLCKTLSHCYRCVVLDGSDSGCHPWTQDFVVTGGWSGQSITHQCNKRNDDGCSQNTCACEMDFMSKIFDLMFKNFATGGFNAELRHDNGFDTSKCVQKKLLTTSTLFTASTTVSTAPMSTPNPGPGGPGGQDIQCCGEYPDREPYNANRKTCCADATGGYSVVSGYSCF